MERTANKEVYFSGNISLWNIFLSLICNSSSVSSSSDHLLKNILNYAITVDGDCGECRTLPLLQKHCVIHAVSCCQKSNPMRQMFSTGQHCKTMPALVHDWCWSCCSFRLLTNFRRYSVSQVLDRGMQPHPSDPTWSQWGFIQPGLVQHLLCLTWAGLCRATGALLLPGPAVTWREIQWGSEVNCRQPVQQGLMIAAVWWWQELHWHHAPPDPVNPPGLQQLSLLWFAMRAAGNEVD